MFGLSHAQLAYIAFGALWTVGLSAIAFIGGTAIGFLLALARISPLRGIRAPTSFYIQIVQGTPLIVMLFLMYFGLTVIGLNGLPGIVAAGIALILYSSAFLAEIWRGCLQSVPKTQWEAAECLALSRWQRMFRVILPQTLRIATPPTVGFLVQIVKDTSLASVIGFIELAQAGKIVDNAVFRPFTVFLIIAFFYFVMCFPLSLWSRRLERKLNVVGR